MTKPASSSTNDSDRLETIVDHILHATDVRPTVGVICGSGLSGLSRCLTESHTLTYASIPHFPQATVVGHAGELVFGYLPPRDSDDDRRNEQNKIAVVCMRGRFHTYEGYDIQQTTLPVRVMAMLGVETLVVTNAAGALNPQYRVGDVMILSDHLNLPGLAGKHPLVGPNDPRFGPRFTPLSHCYDPVLQRLAWDVAQRLKFCVRPKGVYCFVSGPTYETQIEARFLQMLGGDAVGMSTVPEVVVAAHCGLRVLGLSLITNKVLMPGDQSSTAASHDEVLEAVRATQSAIEEYVGELIQAIGDRSGSSELDAPEDEAKPIPQTWLVFEQPTWFGAGLALSLTCSALMVLSRARGWL